MVRHSRKKVVRIIFFVSFTLFIICLVKLNKSFNLISFKKTTCQQHRNRRIPFEKDTTVRTTLDGIKEDILHETRETSQNIIHNLRKLVSDLIEIRSELKGEAATLIERKYNYFQNILLQMEKRQKNVESDKLSKQKDSPSYSCPEIFRGSHFGYPFFKKGFERLNCSVAPIKDSVTIILDRPSLKPGNGINAVANILNGIQKFYGYIRIHVILQNSADNSLLKGLVSTKSNVILVPSKDDMETYADILNQVLSTVTTPFVLIIPYLTSFDENINIERLLGVLTSSDKIAAVGGALKYPEDGQWNSGCLQFNLKNYTLTYKSGYFTSRQECMHCNDLPGPYLVRTEMLEKHKFWYTLNEGLYRDWFLQLKKKNMHKHKNMLVLSCPDVLFGINPTKIEDKMLLNFANRWDIKKIIEPNGQIRWYGCRRGINYLNAGEKCTFGQGMAVPPCCLENLADAIKFVMKTCEQFEITCELQEGTLLGAVKFHKVLPWERDADITFLSQDFEKLQSLKSYFRRQSYDLEVQGMPYFLRW